MPLITLRHLLDGRVVLHLTLHPASRNVAKDGSANGKALDQFEAGGDADPVPVQQHRRPRPRLRSSRHLPTSWTPTGRLAGPRSRGRLIAGTPSSDQIVQKTGLPVLSRPIGASPVAAGVRIAS